MTEFTASHKVVIDEETLNMFADKVTEVKVMLANGIIPQYPEFVGKLFKLLNTPEDSIHHAATGIGTEAGEILSTSKKLWVYGKALDVENIVEELGDIRFYYQAMLNMLGLTDNHIMWLNQHKLQQRYPKGEYSDERAIHRLDKQETEEEVYLNEAIEDLKKYYGLRPYNDSSNGLLGNEPFRTNIENNYSANILDRAKTVIKPLLDSELGEGTYTL